MRAQKPDPRDDAQELRLITELITLYDVDTAFPRTMTEHQSVYRTREALSERAQRIKQRLSPPPPEPEH